MTRSNHERPITSRHGHVVNELGARIVSGELEPGEAIPTEEQLIDEFLVGRSALREGVKVLAGKGLIESRTSAGTRIRERESWNLLDPDVLRWRFTPDASPDDIRMLADLRVALEPGAARLAAESRNVALRRAVSLAMVELWATADEPEQFVEADLAFHRAVFVAAENDLLLYVHDVIAGALRSIRPIHTHSIAHNKDTLENHEVVAVSIVRGNHRRAESAMRAIVEVARADALAEIARLSTNSERD